MLVKVWKLAVNYLEGIPLEVQMNERSNLNVNTSKKKSQS